MKTLFIIFMLVISLLLMDGPANLAVLVKIKLCGNSRGDCRCPSDAGERRWCGKAHNAEGGGSHGGCCCIDRSSPLGTSTTPCSANHNSCSKPPTKRWCSAILSGPDWNGGAKITSRLHHDHSGRSNYSDCGGAFYKAAFQGNNLVYVVVEKPFK